MRVREIKKCYVVTLLVMIQIVSWICATGRPIASSHVSSYPELPSPQAEGHNSRKPNENEKMEEMEKGRSIGSKPPSCKKQCYGCEPCEAVQVPTISSIPHMSPNYANYQPEGWRCHCPP